MKKRVVVFFQVIFLVLSSLLLIQIVSSDGGMVIHDPDMSGWKPLQENSQFAFINYQEGIEKMILTVSIEEMKGTQAVWIFPVPAPHEQTHIDILKETPVLLGTPIEKITSNSVITAFVLMSATQIYPAPFLLFFFISSRFLSAGNTKGGYLQEENFYQDVKIYEQVRKGGVTTQLITARTADSLSAYVNSKNLTFPDKLNVVLESYINQEYSFVITWISDVEEFKKYSPRPYNYRYAPSTYSLGVYVEFPTEEIYFPLKPTSMYEEKAIPITIYVINYVTPKVYPGIIENTKTEYYYQNYHYIPENLTRFFGDIKQLKYTKIKINVSSDDLTQDLIIKNEVPVKVKIQELIQKNILLLSLCLFALLSCLSSLFCGLIFFRKQQPSMLKFFFFGLFNFLTFIGFSMIACLLKVDERFVVIKEKSNKSSIKKVAIKTLIVSLIIAGIIILLFLMPSIIFTLSSIKSLFYSLTSLFAALIFALIIGGFFFLFLGPLIYAGHKNKKLLKFLIFFSILFDILLILSWIMINQAIK